uniref:Major facilitator superfamily (MFS) profile domain-containing protein n=1 Tax=Timema douglasi TaxID=61478 RepID=A0A7R8VGF5_TIMDO|nr:unnamed protein product [Timema douglasi]
MDSRLKKQAHPKGKSEDVKSNLSTSKRGVGKTVELVPPDGGWGWAVMLGNALSNMITNPLIQTFTLLYKDRFNEIGMSATDASMIINVNYAFGMGLGLIHGAVLKRFSYRKVAIVASILNAIGVGLTSFANSFIHFLMTYGLLNSLGASFFHPSFSLALNSYFKKKRGKAMGYSMTLTGIGPIIMPLLISKLMSVYGVQGTGLILSALSLHSLVGAFLLQPIKWHMKRKEEDPVEDEGNRQEDEDNTIISESSPNKFVSRFGVESLTQEEPINSENSIKIFDETTYTALKQTDDVENSDGIQNKINKVKNRKGAFQRLLERIASILDLSLLKDTHYIILMLGMNIVMSAELNFSFLTPLILDELGLSDYQTATIMSTIAAADIIFRFSSPFFADYVGYSVRTMYLISMVMLIASRMTIIFVNTFHPLLGVAVALGIAKGVRSVYMGLVMPSYVPLDRLPSATGLQMVFNGIMMIMFGPFIGFVRDVSGSYNWCIVAINGMTALTIVMWLTESAITNWRRRNLQIIIKSVN